MSKNYALKADKRDGSGKGVARALRRDNKTPAVIYGDKKAPVTIALGANAINVEYNKGHMFTNICDLDVSGEKHQVLARDVQLHPVTDIVQHVDFLRVTEKTKLAVDVPVHIIGHDDSPGIQEKGVLNIVRHDVELMCSAMDIPEFIEVSIAGKEIGDSIHISDAKLPEGTKPVIDDRDFTIATISAPRTIEEIEAEEAAEAAEDAEGAEGEAAEGAEGEEGGDAKAEGGEEGGKKDE